MKDRPFQLTDRVRKTSYAIHLNHGCGHLEKAYGFVHQLCQLGLNVQHQRALTVYDQDGTGIGEYFADLIVEDHLIVEVKAAKAFADEPLAQVFGYLAQPGWNRASW